ncbi:hypothetical protein SAMN05216215_104512 [Saccharopolyspora shandongensis]|uniref:Fe2OG dioxygenase domain-containing protein n=1 Tax=Saccharopolyspora shandongensis TaxID=418495 RepID=A0A1H3Q1P0_9PSEU|nr:hypothetical protein [Saccharopolyspora shandongensis]SDZ07048.1 hypothetical protein SAMN05216215_104512 [Saccharopolyspora shandongensis]
MTTTKVTLGDVIDLERYPIDQLNSRKGRALIDFCHASLAFEGACQLAGFFRPEAVDRLVAEAQEKQSAAYRTDDTHNVYFEQVPSESAADNPAAVLQHSSKLTIAWDLVGEDSPLRVAYESDELTTFLGQALGMETFYRYADPLGAASLMIFNEGDELGWHFDRSPFAVTVMLHPVVFGGEYQYFHNLRTADNQNSSGVLAALRGEQPGRITLAGEPGALTMFRGQHSLHRVTPVEGAEPRINAVLSYSERPGDKLNALTQQLFYGRTA